MQGYQAPLHKPCLYRRDRGLDDSGEQLPDTLMPRQQIDDILFAMHSKDEFDTAVNELKLHMDIEGETNWLCIIMVLKLNRGENT